MARKPYVNPLWKEVTFKYENLDARALLTRTDLRGIVTFASKAYRNMTKLDRKEILNNPHSIVRHPFMPELIFKRMWDTIQKGEQFRGLVMNLRKDGYHYWVEVHIQPIDEEGNVVNDPMKIKGYLAIRREPKRDEIQKAYAVYKSMRKAELLEKHSLKEWEKELLELIDKLPQNADSLLVKK